ncbi:amidase [Lentibacillus saliphilus]|uniref:amidase n=1 Tax=Lentibacillus saliphilus TaxID=2737028 RepID=UPI001C2FEFA1|nr:amidase [Lentibacillus saliphilus]
MINHKIYSRDATYLSKAIKQGDYTSTYLVTQFIEHIKHVNPAVNAVVEDRFHNALREAERADQQIAENKEIGPLHGVPISVKESYDVQGMKTTGGLLHRQDLMVKKDADVITRLKEAGAIILGKTNTPTLCFCQETDNKLYGKTNNPWDLACTAGGSSGGEGALLSVGGAAVGVGSDIGGSIRFPAHFNGVIGFKPGRNQVSDAGHFPTVTNSLQHRMLGIGPMGKSVRDMRLLYSIMSGSKQSEQNIEPFNIDVITPDGDNPLDASGQQLMKQIQHHLGESFLTTFATPPFWDSSAQLWQEIMSIDGAASIKKEAFPSDRLSPWKAYIQESITHKTNHHTYLSWALIGAQLFKPSMKRQMDIAHILREGDQQLDSYFNNRILISPVYHRGAPEHGTVYKEIFSIKKSFRKYMPFTAYANVWGLPALVVPVGQDEAGMPIAIQLMSKNGNEDALFKLGEIIEKAWGGYERCNHYDKEIVIK